MANQSLPPPLALRHINYEHIYHRHVEEKEKNPVPPFVGKVLRTIGRTQLVRHIYTAHMRSVFEVYRRCHDIFPFRPVPPRHCGHRHTGVSNGNSMGEQN
jgi:hypothetical protein